MASKLFLLEFQIGNIEFENSFQPIPAKKDILINIKFLNASIDIDPTEIHVQADSSSLLHCEKIPFDMGKSYLFTSTHSDLLENMKTGKIELSLRINQKTEGSALLPWTEDFQRVIKLINKTSTTGPKSANYSETSSLVNKSGKVIAKMGVYIRLGCFEDCIDSEYVIKNTTTGKHYYFKNPQDKTIIKCDIMEGGNSMLPVSTLMSVTSKADAMDEAHAFSWIEIFGVGSLSAKDSYSPFTGPEMQNRIPLTEILQHNSVETVSIIFRPEENKFLDFTNMFNTELSNTQETAMLTFVKNGKTRTQSHGSTTKEDDPLELTADMINRKLCKNKDCPAAKKFKEYGIGPLATGKGLGTVYGDVESTVEYGLSNTYGSMSKYGPFGIFTRPKNPEEPYIPPKNRQEPRLLIEPEKKPCCCCSRLRGGGPWPDQFFVLIENSVCNKTTRKRTLSPEILRLKEGAPEPSMKRYSSEMLQKVLVAKMFRLRGGGPLESDEIPDMLKSPIKECKPVMDKFDEILAAYKRVLGPCGQAICPNSPSLIDRRCQEVCREGRNPAQEDDMYTDRGATNESRKRLLCEDPCDPTKNIPPPACGNPKCAYTKYKLDLVDDDAALELEYLPPAVSGRCGHAKCRYPFEPNLPPIHWDCPDPLPKGKCKNLNCPFQPRQLRKFKTKEPKPGPCGSTNCPYALPPPCEIPTCPFRPKPCPFLEGQELEEDTCENPECPFANKEIDLSESFDENLEVTGEFVSCPNPICPFTTQGTRRPKPKSCKPNVCETPTCPFSKVKRVTICDNPQCSSAPRPPCPFALPPKKENDICGNPQCPFAPPSSQGDDDCDNPQCPFAPKPKNKNNLCSNPYCPNAPKIKKKESVCSNPECPSALKKKKGNGCGDPACPSTPEQKEDDFICGDPQCPFAEGKRTKRSSDKTSDCFRPNKTDDTCDNPECPDNREKDSDDSTDSNSKESICDNPDCPYAEKESICDNPDCPYAEKESLNEDEICDDPLCPYGLPLSSCGIPACPYEPIPSTPCPTHIKGKKAKKSRKPSGRSGKICAVQESTIPTEGVEQETGDVEVSETVKKGKKKKHGKFVYSMGNRYTGVQVGHKECITPLFQVPPKMGWLWNVPLLMAKNYKPRRGWRPGAIQRSIAARIKAHREAKGLGILDVPKFYRGEDGHIEDPDYEVPVVPKPTLQIQKKDGTYWITMNPLKDPKSLVYRENPYMDCTPMQFKITKNKNKKKEAGDDDSRLCYCDEEEEESSSDSELDIEFTPPAGIIHPERFKKKSNIVHCEVQYDPKDFAIAKNKGKEKKGKKGKGKKGKKGKK